MDRLFEQEIYNHGLESAADTVIERAAEGSGYGCLTNVHMIVEQRHNPALAEAMRGSTWNFPDGKPVSLALKLQHEPDADQVPGPALMEAVCARAAEIGLPVFLHGGTQAVLDALVDQLPQRYPGLEIAGAYSPPFAPLSDESMRDDAERIVASGARITLVGLGCPKQELWMYGNRERVPGVMLGVGAAFPMLAGMTPRAPSWLSSCCLEWAYRLVQEPRRLWRRYASTNPAFVYYLSLELIGDRLTGRSHR